MAETHHCSLCGQRNHDVALLIAGVTGMICEQCIVACFGVLQERAAEAVKIIWLNRKPTPPVEAA